jgi:hypothetical protein
MATVTLRELMDAGVCYEQLQVFRHVFGNEADKTMTNALRAFRVFDWVAGADKFLDLEHRLDFDDKVEEARHAFFVGRRALRATYKAGGLAEVFDARQPLAFPSGCVSFPFLPAFRWHDVLAIRDLRPDSS